MRTLTCTHCQQSYTGNYHADKKYCPTCYEEVNRIRGTEEYRRTHPIRRPEDTWTCKPMLCKHWDACCRDVFRGARLPCEVVPTPAAAWERDDGDGDRSVVEMASVVEVMA